MAIITQRYPHEIFGIGRYRLEKMVDVIISKLQVRVIYAQMVHGKITQRQWNYNKLP